LLAIRLSFEFHTTVPAHFQAVRTADYLNIDRLDLYEEYL